LFYGACIALEGPGNPSLNVRKNSIDGVYFGVNITFGMAGPFNIDLTITDEK